MVGEKDSFEITVSLADFESVDAKLREKRGEPAEAAVPVETDFAVMYSGTGNGQVGITGEQNGRYEILVEITESGYLGDGHFAYSLDGGETWQGEADFEIPLSGFYEIPLTGLTLASCGCGGLHGGRLPVLAGINLLRRLPEELLIADGRVQGACFKGRDHTVTEKCDLLSLVYGHTQTGILPFSSNDPKRSGSPSSHRYIQPYAAANCLSVFYINPGKTH